MRTRTPQKSGVIGVTGVMKALKALRGVAFREITQGTGSAYTTCNLHHRCNASSDTIPAPFLPVGLLRHEQTSAGMVADFGAWGVMIG